MESFLLRGIIIGFVFGVPAGVIGALTIQRTMAHGPLVGMVTGLGSTAADCIYAVVCCCGITAISGILTKYQRNISIVGGILIVIIGITIVRKETAVKTETSEKGVVGSFLSSFMLALTNPATILSFMVVFTAFGITGRLAVNDALGLVIGIFLGTSIWWGIVTGISYKFRSKMTDKIYHVLNTVLGSLIIIFGMAALIKGVL